MPPSPKELNFQSSISRLKTQQILSVPEAVNAVYLYRRTLSNLKLCPKLGTYLVASGQLHIQLLRQTRAPSEREEITIPYKRMKRRTWVGLPFRLAPTVVEVFLGGPIQPQSSRGLPQWRQRKGRARHLKRRKNCHYRISPPSSCLHQSLLTGEQDSQRMILVVSPGKAQRLRYHHHL